MTQNRSRLCPICGKPNTSHFGDDLKRCQQKRKNMQYLERRTPPLHEQRRIMNKQQGKCFLCKEYWKHVEFHHPEGRWSDEGTIALFKDCQGDITLGNLEL